MKITAIIALFAAFVLVATPLWTTGASAEYTVGDDWTMVGLCWSGSIIFTDENTGEAASYWIEFEMFGAPSNEEIHAEGNKEIHGLKGFTYKVYKDRQDVRDGGTPIMEWISNFGQDDELQAAPSSNEVHSEETIELPFDFIDGVETFNVAKIKILVHSNSELLNKHMDNNTSFQIILSIMQDSYPEGLGLKQFTFDGCHCDDREFQLDSHGYALTTYTFTGDRIREA